MPIVKEKLKPEDRFNPIRSEFTTSKGHTLKLNPIGPGALEYKRRQFTKYIGKPKPPLIELNHGKNRKSMVDDLSAPNYLLAMQQHDSEVGSMITEWIFYVGVETDPPENVLETNLLFAKIVESPEDANGNTLGPKLPQVTYKYLWVNSLIDAFDFQFLIEAIVGQQALTQGGLVAAADDFPDQS